MVALASESNLICRTWLLLNSLYSKMSFWRSLSKNCSKSCPFIVCVGSSPFTCITSAWMPSQVTLQLKVLGNFFSMQSLPLGLHFFKSCDDVVYIWYYHIYTLYAGIDNSQGTQLHSSSSFLVRQFSYNSTSQFLSFNGIFRKSSLAVILLTTVIS